MSKTELNNNSLTYIITVDGQDYTIASTTVSVPAAWIEKLFAIRIINDNIMECNETFKLTLSVPISTCGAVNGTVDTTKVTIVDNDSRKSVIELCCFFIYVLIYRSIIIHYTVKIFY